MSSLLCLLLSKVASAGVPFLYRMIVDALDPQKVILWSSLLLIGGYGVVRLSSVLFAELRDIIFAGVEQQTIRDVGRNVFKHLHNLSLRFHLNRKTGELTRVIERGTRSIEIFLKHFVFNLLPTFLELALIFFIILYFYPVQFALVILVTLAAYIVFTFWVSSWRLKFMRSMNKASNETGIKAVDSLLNYTTVKFFGHEALEVAQYDTFLKDYARQAILNRRSLALLNFGQGVILTLGLVTMMFLSAPWVESHQFSIGDFVMLNTYLLQVYAPLYILGFAYREAKQARIDMEDLFSLLSTPQEIQDAPKAKALTFHRGKIVFQNVCFAYTQERPILENISFTIEPGQTCAIVGASGAGKSTIVSLLLRFFDPTGGKILIDGQNIRSVTQASLRSFMGVVPQDTVLFNNTIRYNIRYGKPDASEEEVIAASKRAKLHNFVMRLPEDYGTLVGERGLKLSGGEKQRLAIARVALKNPHIFVFDEATSSLDSHTEKDIQKNLEACSKGSTTLMIAHRLSTVIKAHQILVLGANGHIIERGTHKTLLKEGGAYKSLWDKQYTESHQTSDTGHIGR
jgi:ATP-binding cassette subfamily B protein